MTISEQIENILRVSKAARNSDVELLIIYMQKSGMRLSDNQIAIFRKMPSVETLRRTRQKLQEQGKYPADKAVDDARFEKYKAVKYNIKHETPESLLEGRGIKLHEWGKDGYY